MKGKTYTPRGVTPRRAYQLALSGKKTLFKRKKPTLYYVNVYDEKGYPTGEHKVSYITKFKPCDYPLSGDNWYHKDLYGNRATEAIPPFNGNIVIGYSSSCYLILDCDLQTKATVIYFAKKYTKFHGLGSVLVMRTSKSSQEDLYMNKLANYAVIFGLPLPWEEIAWHLQEVRRLGMVNRVNSVFARFGYITSRINAKNKDTPPPQIVKFFANGSMLGIRDYFQFLNRYKDFGF
jgi:hypothetical protein